MKDEQIEGQEAEGEEPVVLEEPDQGDPEAETEARKYGWRPKEEFDRDPAGWVDAKRFLEMPATIVKVQRDSLKEIRRDLAERDERLARMEGMTRAAVERAREQERAAYEGKIAEIRNAQRAAAAEGDITRFDQLARQEQQIKPPPPIQQASGQRPEVEEFKKTDEGAWLHNPSAFQFAYAEIERNPSVQVLPVHKQLEWATRRVHDVFPEYAPKPQQSRAPKVDGGGVGSMRRNGKGSADLPEEARRAGKELVEDGIFKSIEEYAKEYWAQEAGR